MTGAERPPAAKLTPLLAYRHQGKPLDPTEDGPLRLVFAEPKADAVVDGHWSVRWVDKLQVKKSLGQWQRLGAGRDALDPDPGLLRVVRLAGLPRQRVGRHRRDTLDGVPLWLVVGSVDDAAPTAPAPSTRGWPRRATPSS